MKVIIEVEDHGDHFYLNGYNKCVISKSDCTVIEDKQEQEPINTGMKKFSPLTPYPVLYTFMYNQEQKIKYLQAKLNIYAIEQGITMKHVQPQPAPTMYYEGKEMQDDTDVYWIIKESFNIESIKWEFAKGVDSDFFGETKKSTKIYAIKSEVNNRLKEMVIEEAKKRVFTFGELEEYDNDWFMLKKPLDYAIELVEKEKGVKYL